MSSTRSTGTVVLLPRGTRLLGRYDSGVAFGQERALVVWQRLILPDGASVVVENLPAADEVGYAGLSDTVGIHGWQLARGILLSSLLGVGTELAWKGEGDVTRAFRESVQDGPTRQRARLCNANSMSSRPSGCAPAGRSRCWSIGTWCSGRGGVRQDRRRSPGASSGGSGQTGGRKARWGRS